MILNRVAVAVFLLALLCVAACGGDDPTPRPEKATNESGSEPSSAWDEWYERNKADIEELKSALKSAPPWAKVAPEQIAEAKKHGVPVAFENELGMRFVLIPAGKFLMGSPKDEEHRDTDEFLHEVTIPQPFYAQITEATKGQFRQFDDWYQSDEMRALLRRPPPHDGEDHPAQVGHLGGRHFAAWLTLRDKARAYRLPTEEEWEYACRAGTKTAHWWGKSGRDVWRHANTRGPSDRHDGHSGLAPVAQYTPNAWGLYDMLGNVSEACSVLYRPYPGADDEARERHDDLMRRFGGYAVVRGGSWHDAAMFTRSAFRFARRAQGGYRRVFGGGVGFRLVSPLPEK